ncbi:protein kinase, partial [Streptomyces sp. NPDC048845]
IKPANVIITHGGAVKVMDFGIARALHGAQSTMTQTGMVMGTPQYLSPEQALGKTVDTRSDLYATGCLLYELLALRPPFVGETPLSVVYQHVQDNPVPPSQLSDSVPPELDGLVMRSLAKEPDDRFQSAEEMRGMVQYALRMLGERGGWTSTWDTGPVTHAGASTPAMGGAAIGGGALAHPGHSDTSQIPAPLLGSPRGDDGGYDGGPRGNGNGGAGRGKLWLFMALALIAVTVGVVIALQKADTGKGDNPNPKPSDSQSQEEKPTETPSEEQSSEGTGEEPGTGDTGDVTPTDGGTGDWSPSPTTSPSATTSPSETEGDGGAGGGNGGGDPDPSTPTQTGDEGGGPGGDDGGGDQPTTLPTGGGGGNEDGE